MLIPVLASNDYENMDMEIMKGSRAEQDKNRKSSQLSNTRKIFSK